MKVPKKDFMPKYKVIPAQLMEKQFSEFILPHLSVGRSGPKSPIPFHRLFNYILMVIYTGMQWRTDPIKRKW
jgi:hypothetical protein